MNKLNIIENMGFKISWKLIQIGLYGYDRIPILLTYNEVLEYLDGLLINPNEQTDNIIALICEKDNPEELRSLLNKFVGNDESDIIVQKRKWRAYLLKSLIDNIDHDFLQGLLELMEFWMSMGKPEDCPHIFPDPKDTESVQSYFTQSSYDFLLQRNCLWLEKEIYNIVTLENYRYSSKIDSAPTNEITRGTN